MTRIEVELPFWGFYESWHDAKINDAIESAFTYDHETGEDVELSEDDLNAIYDADINWSAIQHEYAKTYVEMFAEETGLDLQYADMTSPREYNFTSDRLFATMPAQELAKLRKEVETYPEYADTIKERFTSYDGFISFYENDVKHEDWTRPELDQCQYQVLIELWLKHNGHEDIEDVIAGDILVNEFDSVNEAIEKIEQYKTKLQEAK